jgi:transcriptional regulator with XRE-family HTH domain
MTPDQFRRRREAMGLSQTELAAYLGVTSADVVRCERAPRYDAFVLALAMAYVELLLEAERTPKLVWTRSARVSECEPNVVMALAAAAR